MSEIKKPEGDENVWLEEVDGEKPLDWVKEQNKVSVSTIGDPKGSEDYTKILKVLESKDKIPYVHEKGNLHYNLWTDEKNKKGLWRRTTLEEYQKPSPEWETVLDIDALNEKEGENFVWKGSTLLDLGPDDPKDRVLLKLSRGGADATVVREFDLVTKEFVTENAFILDEAKSSFSWKSRDVLYVGTNFGEGSLTDSGYPRIVKEWKRGTPLEEATTIFEGEKEDVAVHGYHYFDKGATHHFISRSITFYTSEYLYLHSNKWEKIPVPEDVSVSTFADQFVITLRKDWVVDDKRTFVSGALLTCPVDELMNGNLDHLVALFEPTARISMSHYTTTKNYLIKFVLDNVITKMDCLKFDSTTKTFEPVDRQFELPPMARPSASGLNADTSDMIWLTSSGYTQPTTLYIANVDESNSQKIVKQLPSGYDANGLVVEQHEATSKDGTKIPYFVVRRKDQVANGNNPTLLYGYGGFEISLLPGYSATVGIGWLEKGGTWVEANIRGGGEFGPKWHQAALKENRNKAYEDFIAVGEDIIQRKITSTPKLGIMGGSNGGLLMGNMMTMRPDLWGAIVCQVPLLDMQRFNILLAGASWMGEYGDPDKPEEWAWLKNYSPYHNLKKDTIYPAALFTTSTRDDRVHPGHARKMVRRLLDNGSKNTLYYENIEGGHGGAADNTQRAFMKTLEYGFLWNTLNKSSL